jgi:hypothetical protein
VGLGLYICRALIEQHGGQVGVKSQLNVGSTFTLTLPLLEPQLTGTPLIPKQQTSCDSAPTISYDPKLVS